MGPDNPMSSLEYVPSEPLFDPTVPIREGSRDDILRLMASYPGALMESSSDRLAGRPDFMVISPCKTGTSWLASHLGRHPEIFVPPGKEARFFDNYYRFHDLNWYLDIYAGALDRIKGDISPTYAWLPKYAIQLIRDLNPRLKLVILARRLPEQAWSHTRHCFRYRVSVFRHCTRSLGSLPDSILRYLLSDQSLSASDYPALIRRWMRYFPVSQFHVWYFEDAMERPAEYLMDLCRFLGADAEFDFAQANLHEKVFPGITLAAPNWTRSMLAQIYSARQSEAETYLKETFGLTSPWEPLPYPSVAAPVSLQEHSNGWRISFDEGRFRAVRGGELRREDYGGDLLNQLDEQGGGSKDWEEARLTDILLGLHRDHDAPLFQLAERDRGFSIFHNRASVYAVRDTLGDVDLWIGDDLLEQRYAPQDLIIGPSDAEIKERIGSLTGDGQTAN